MKRIKINALFVAILLGIMMVLGVAGCDKTPVEVEPGCYGLQQAYDLGLLTKNDLETIAYYDNGVKYPKALDPQIAAVIKELEAEDWRNRDDHPKPEATAEDFTIVKYLGTYSGCYVVAMDNIYVSYPAYPGPYWVEGVVFYHGNYSIQVWKIDLE